VPSQHAIRAHETGASVTTERGALFTFDHSAVGVEVDAGVVTVTREAIAAYCAALEETNPLWTDAAWAASGPYGGIIAPPAFVTTLPARSGLNPRVKFGNSTFLGGRRIEAFEPVHPGDTITIREEVQEPFAKTGRTGTMVFAIRRVTYRNQHRRTVAVAETSTLYRQTTAVAASSAPEAPPGPTVITHAARPVRGQRYFGDVEPADEFEGTWDVTREMVAAFLNLSRNPNAPTPPNASYFLDPTAAANNGLERPVAHGGLSTAICMRLVTDWIGPRGWLRSIDASFRRPAMHGDHLRVLGLVTDVTDVTDATDGATGPTLTIDVSLENERGERPIQGVAEVTLPRRSA
jgi:acyl dehydratase